MVADYATTGVTAGRAPDGARARGPARRRRPRRRPRAAAPRRSGSASAASWWPASGRRPPTGSSSCCSRTSTGRSTSSSRRRPTTATGWSSAGSRWCSPRAGSRSTRRRRGRSTSWWTRSGRWTRAASARPADVIPLLVVRRRAARTRWPTREPVDPWAPAAAAAGGSGGAGLRRGRPPVHELRAGAPTMIAGTREWCATGGSAGRVPRAHGRPRLRPVLGRSSRSGSSTWACAPIASRADVGQRQPRRPHVLVRRRSRSSLLGFGVGLPIAASLGRDSELRVGPDGGHRRS